MEPCDLDTLAIKAVYEFLNTNKRVHIVSSAPLDLGEDKYEVSVFVKRGWKRSRYVVEIYAPMRNLLVMTNTYLRNFPAENYASWEQNVNGFWDRFPNPANSTPAPGSAALRRIMKPKADRALDRLDFLLPRRHREILIGDLREDVAAKRKEGWSEKLLCRYVYLQVFYVALERLKPWNWVKGGAFLWIVHKIIG